MPRSPLYQKIHLCKWNYYSWRLFHITIRWTDKPRTIAVFLIFFHILWLLYLQNSIIMFKKYMHDTTICKLLQLVNSIIFFFIKRFQMCNKDDVIEPIVYIYALITCIYLLYRKLKHMCRFTWWWISSHTAIFVAYIYFIYFDVQICFFILYIGLLDIYCDDKNIIINLKKKNTVWNFITEELNDLCHN